MVVLTEAGSKLQTPLAPLIPSLKTAETTVWELKIKIKEKMKSKSCFSLELLEVLCSQYVFSW